MYVFKHSWPDYTWIGCMYTYVCSHIFCYKQTTLTSHCFANTHTHAHCDVLKYTFDRCHLLQRCRGQLVPRITVNNKNNNYCFNTVIKQTKYLLCCMISLNGSPLRRLRSLRFCTIDCRHSWSSLAISLLAVSSVYSCSNKIFNLSSARTSEETLARCQIDAYFLTACPIQSFSTRHNFAALIIYGSAKMFLLLF